MNVFLAKKARTQKFYGFLINEWTFFVFYLPDLYDYELDYTKAYTF